jgi:glycosyltransferase involved in cell wall biosynthesis
MKIAIDIRTVSSRRSGVGNYVLNLVQNLREVDRDSTYYFLGMKKNFPLLGVDLIPPKKLVTFVSPENHPLSDIWEHFLLPLRLAKEKVDVFHGPASLIPFVKKGYGICVTIHDLVAFLFPRTIPRRYGVYMRFLLRQAVKKADRIIAVSHHTQQDLVSILKVPPEKIAVIHEAPASIFRPLDRLTVQRRLKERYGLEGKYIYHVGNIEPRKNLIHLLEAFILVCREVDEPYRLVVSGQKGWLVGSLRRYYKAYPLRERIFFTGYVPEEDLPYLMNGAELFVFPSLYEGFGLPVLEAMSCGTPVITSNCSSLPEIVGTAAVLTDPADVRGLADRIIEVLSRPEERERLRQAGREQAARFTWTETARKTFEVYKAVAGHANPL